MGIISYLFHRSPGLSKQRFTQFFLDMGENIHFHYRDLRIEFSVDEFAELAAKFDECKEGVIKEIEAGYRDGVLPNTNEVGTIKTFWPEGRKLAHPVKYNDEMISLEETADGYHLHLRNYKILLDKASFTTLAEAMAEAMAVLHSKEVVRDPFTLLEHNELHPRLLSRLITEEGENLFIAMENSFRGKAGKVLKALGYLPVKSDGKVKVFTRDSSTVHLGEPGSMDSAEGLVGSTRNSSMDLVSYAARYCSSLGGKRLNELKLKVYYLCKLAQLKKMPVFTLEDVMVDVATRVPRVDLFAKHDGVVNMENEYARFKTILNSKKLSLVKPRKKLLSNADQERLQAKFMDYLIEKIIPHPCISKIYVMGSSTRLQAGVYEVPFVHIDWAKLKSDFDVYIEIDPDYEDQIPEEWERKFTYKVNGSVYYHLGDVGQGEKSEYAAKYPELRFYEHLVEAFLFFPSQGDVEAKEKALIRSKAQLVFARDGIKEWVEKTYQLAISNAARFRAASFNKVYRISGAQGTYALKIYVTKYLRKKRQECVHYEVDMLNGLRESGLELPFPIRDHSGGYINPMGDDQVVMFQCLEGKFIRDPSAEQAMAAGKELARFHLAAKDYTSRYQQDYDNKAAPMTWVNAWADYKQQGKLDDSPLKDITPYKERLTSLNTFPTHCHGDLSPINYLYDEDGRCRLIDFQNLGYGPAIIDLANGMTEFAARQGEFWMDNLEGFQRGYESIRPLAPEEHEALNDLVIVQIAARQSRLLRLHYGGYGYKINTARLTGLNRGFAEMLTR